MIREVADQVAGGAEVVAEVIEQVNINQLLPLAECADLVQAVVSEVEVQADAAQVVGGEDQAHLLPPTLDRVEEVARYAAGCRRQGAVAEGGQ